MASVADLDTELAGQAALLAAAPTRLDSDYLDEYQAVPVGGARFQLRCNAAGKDSSDANVIYQVAAVVLVVVHALANPVNERAYTKGNLQTDLALLTSFAFWRQRTSVHELLAESLSFEWTRVGNLIVSTVEARVKLAP